MSHASEQLAQLTKLRRELQLLKASSSAALAEIVLHSSEPKPLPRMLRANSSTSDSSPTTPFEIRQNYVNAHNAERQKRRDIAALLTQWLDVNDPAKDVQKISANYPVALFPVRLETCFSPVGAPTELKIRIYPDEILANNHEERLTELEYKAGCAYWRAAWNSATHLEAWNQLATTFSAPRAAWIAHRTEPSNLQERPTVTPQFPSISDPEFTAFEIQAGQAYWKSVWNPAFQEEEAWSQLVAQISERRAKIIKEITQPINLGEKPIVQPNFFPQADPSPERWARPVETHLLPDRWIVIAYRGEQEIHRVISQPVVEPLALTIDPMMVIKDDEELTAEQLVQTPDLAWLYNFEEAEKVGMAVRIPLTAQDITAGFDRIVALGIKASLPAQSADMDDMQCGDKQLASLIEAHHYTRGFAFVPQGTPTNNTNAAPANYPPPDPGSSVSFKVECEDQAVAPFCDGRIFMRALGLSENLAAHLAGSARIEQQNTSLMNQALWSATIGYFVEQFLVPGLQAQPSDETTFTTEKIQQIKQHFIKYVHGRGTLPIFRVGQTPYGLFPVSSLNHRASRKGDWINSLRSLRNQWLQAVPKVPHVGRSIDLDADLLEILGMDANSRQIRVRAALGTDVILNLQHSLQHGHGLDRQTWLTVHQEVINLLNRALDNPEWLPYPPRVCDLTLDDNAHLLKTRLVYHKPVSEEEPLPEVINRRGVTYRNYIDWIAKASIEELRESSGDIYQEHPESRPLLYLLLRHAMLSEYARAAFDILIASGSNLVHPDEWREYELIGVVGTENRKTIWEKFQTKLGDIVPNLPPTFKDKKLEDYLWSAGPSLPWTAPSIKRIASYRQALQRLVPLSASELERLLTETLDVCSHRLDAWITSLAAQQLEEMRTKTGEGIYLGAYGWIENLHPAPANRYTQETYGETKVVVQNNSGGYIHAPSTDHATAAAILRSGYLTRSTDDRKQYAIDLSSERVRTANQILDAIRAEQPLAAVLGYRIERILHEHHLDRYIDPLRHLFPLIPRRCPDVPHGETIEAVAARNVIDGLMLRQKWPDKITWATEGLPPQDPKDKGYQALRSALDAEFGIVGTSKALDPLDAVSDLLTAESVYQLVRGNVAASAANLDALARGVRPPQPQIAHLPRSRTDLTHRVAVILGEPLVSLDVNWQWGNTLTPRAQAEPFLDRWIGSLLGDPANVLCRVKHPITGGFAEVTISLADLELRPIDLLSLSSTGTNASQVSDLMNARVKYAALKKINQSEMLDSDCLQIIYSHLPDWSRIRIRTFPEVLELIRSINKLVSSARPLHPKDLLPPESEALTKDAQWELKNQDTGAVDRALQAFGTLQNTISSLRAKVASLRSDALEQAINSSNGPQPEDIPNLEPLRKVLFATADLGLATVPASVKDPLLNSSDTLDVRRTVAKTILKRLQALLSQAEGSRIELERRMKESEPLNQILSSPDGITPEIQVEKASELVKIVFGNKDIPFLVAFQPPASQLDQLRAALDFGAELVDQDPIQRTRILQKWFQQAARVQTPLDNWRRLELYTRSLGAAPTMMSVIQLPYQPPDQLPHQQRDRWVGLPFEETERPPAGRTSIVLLQPNQALAKDYWAGLLLAGWTESIPNSSEQTGISFHYDNPAAEAPQCVLLAVPPGEQKTWDLQLLIDTVNETLDLSKIRAVDNEVLEGIGQVLPALLLSKNTNDDAISSNFEDLYWNRRSSD